MESNANDTHASSIILLRLTWTLFTLHIAQYHLSITVEGGLAKALHAINASTHLLPYVGKVWVVGYWVLPKPEFEWVSKKWVYPYPKNTQLWVFFG